MPWRTASLGVLDLDRLALDQDLARVDRVGAEDRPCDLGSAGTDETGEPEDLAAVELEAHVADLRVRG